MWFVWDRSTKISFCCFCRASDFIGWAVARHFQFNIQSHWTKVSTSMTRSRRARHIDAYCIHDMVGSPAQARWFSLSVWSQYKTTCCSLEGRSIRYLFEHFYFSHHPRRLCQCCDVVQLELHSWHLDKCLGRKQQPIGQLTVKQW